VIEWLMVAARNPAVLASAKPPLAAECGRTEQADLSASAARANLAHADERMGGLSN